MEFAEEDSRLSVLDDGTGLPDDYAERGNGFANMGRAAGRLGGRLIVEQSGAMGGATGYLQKETGRERLLGAVRDVVRGELRLPVDVVRRTFAAVRRWERPPRSPG